MSPLSTKARRRLLRTRQALIFGALLAAVVLVGLAALAVSLGRMAMPLPAEPFASPSAEEANYGPVPCPSSEHATYPPASRVRIRVLNGSATSGAARAMAEEFFTRGFQLLPVDNAAFRVDGPALIVTGAKGVDHAYTVLLHAPDGATMAFDTRSDNSVDFIVGSDLQNLKPADEIKPGTAWITAPADCESVDVLEAAAQEAAASASASPQDEADPQEEASPPETGEPAAQ